MMNDAEKSPVDLKCLTPNDMERFCSEELGQKPGQGLRLAALLFRKGIKDFDAMTGINRRFREMLKERCAISSLEVIKRSVADDGTQKLLYRLHDGNCVEGVLIPGPDRLTLCVSAQVGCASGCGFCLTGSGGFIRNLSASEMVNQVFSARECAEGRHITNIVLMGTGEPLSNYTAVKTFVEIAVDRNGMGYSGKKVTISTCGIAPMIERLADDGVDASLAVSLNAATDYLRDGIMPVNKAWPLARLKKSLQYYADKTGRTITIEYVLLKGVNESTEDAKRLAGLLTGLPCMVNILLFNPFTGSAFERPEDGRASVFRDILVQSGLVAVVRRSKGRDINAACGQLMAMGQ